MVSPLQPSLCSDYPLPAQVLVELLGVGRDQLHGECGALFLSAGQERIQEGPSDTPLAVILSDS